MSTSSEIVDSGRFSGQNRAPEKSNFSHTCNLFSQYLKENAFPDLTLGRRVTSPSTATMNLFPMTETPRLATQKQQDQSRSMTIFYDGQVMVFNDLTPEKVKEIMMLAEKGIPHKPTTFSSSSIATPKPEEPSNKTGLPIASGSDLPIARKASLARFLEKRKDRITARSPYQMEGAPKQEDSKTWLGLGAQSEVQFQPRS
ncbi:protein TIFY 10A-like [Cynara cardunculus var. scolymus]|uniref:Protein TIFY n=1 Tax=Cynara cardunculus var. scolymus TaxID=59895 RepID=A0A103YNF6_CYNCS|nr:protein TIFY 10A-like [Cynara cardunculus var. scolymus]KVI12235.1 CO/COL/TOC1, conserved site-containing protein [Cynara cardunculus var. scolymus]